MYQCVEDMGRIFVDMMSVRYGVRMVEVNMQMDDPGLQPLGMNLEPQPFLQAFDFSVLKNFPVAIKQDVGASSYWSEMANMQTLDNLLMNHHITLKQYLERLPSGYISKKQELIREIKAMSATPPAGGAATGMAKEHIESMPVKGGPGNGQLQRALNRQGV